MNSIAAYCLAHLIESFVLSSFKTHLPTDAFKVFGDGLAPLVQGAALLFVLWLILFWMYRRKLFLRI
jgi:predicted acyltransferase